MKRFGIVLMVFMFAVSLGGCSCMQKQVMDETPPPVKVAQKAPEPVKPAPPPPPPKKDRN